MRPKQIKQAPAGSRPVGWRQILDNWGAVLLDLLDSGIDLYDPALDSRPWLWLRNVIFGLLSQPTSRLYRVVFPD